jgi:hypothetical protein
MTIDESQVGKAWLSQFPIVEREVGRQLLKSLRLVSHTKFETAISKVLTDLFEELSGENIALFNVVESSNRDDDEGPPRRTPGSSADRVKSLNENLARVHGPRVQAHPTIHFMKAQKMKHVVLVEDFIGTGRRISTYLRDEMSPTLKSWISFGWTKLWIVSYGGLESGVSALVHRGYGLNESRIRLATTPQRAGQYLSPLMMGFCKAYAKRTHRAKMAMGFGAGAVGMLFEHSCPNNAPVVLWSKGPKYKPLFPNRGIPDELAPLFSQEDVNRPATVLWDVSQYRLAIAMLREPHMGHPRSSQWSLLLMLGLASRNGWEDGKIAGTLGIPVAEVAVKRLDAYSISALDPQTHQLTEFGSGMVHRVRASANKKRPIKMREQRPLAETYYPLTYGGLVRH